MGLESHCVNFSFGVVMLHGAVKNPQNMSAGAHSIEVESNAGMAALMEKLKIECALVVAPNSEIIFGSQRWDTNNKATRGVELERLNSLIFEVSKLTSSKKVILMGGSSGALMVHNIALNIENGNTSNQVKAVVKGIVIVDGVSANQVYYSDSPLRDNGFYAETCSGISYVHPSFFHYGTTYIDEQCNASGLDIGGKWTIPTLIISTIQDETVPSFYKEKFINTLVSEGDGKVEYEYVQGNHGNAGWINGIDKIIEEVTHMLRNEK